MGYQKCAPEPPPVPMTHKSDAEAERQRKRDEKAAEARRKEEEERERWRKRDEKAAETWRKYQEVIETWRKSNNPPETKEITIPKQFRGYWCQQDSRHGETDFAFVWAPQTSLCEDDLWVVDTELTVRTTILKDGIIWSCIPLAIDRGRNNDYSFKGRCFKQGDAEPKILNGKAWIDRQGYLLIQPDGDPVPAPPTRGSGG
jgi:hypothetical protein